MNRFWIYMRRYKWRGRPVNQERLAKLSGINRTRLSEIVSNKPGRGGKTRPKLVRALRQRWRKELPEILEQLGWDESGNIKPKTSHVGQNVSCGNKVSDGDAGAQSKPSAERRPH